MSDALEVRRWQAPAVHGPGARPRDQGGAAHVERLAEIEQEAREAGYRHGFAEGERQGLARRQTEAARLAKLADALVPEAGGLDDRLLEQLGALVTVAIRHFVRRELALQPGEVVRVIRDAVAVLPATDARITLHLHPEDAHLVREALQPELLERPWRLVEDLNMTRGGVRVETDVSVVDASVETRLNALFARLLGDGRREQAHD